MDIGSEHAIKEVAHPIAREDGITIVIVSHLVERTGELRGRLRSY